MSTSSTLTTTPSISEKPKSTDSSPTVTANVVVKPTSPENKQDKDKKEDEALNIPPAGYIPTVERAYDIMCSGKEIPKGSDKRAEIKKVAQVNKSEAEEGFKEFTAALTANGVPQKLRESIYADQQSLQGQLKLISALDLSKPADVKSKVNEALKLTLPDKFDDYLKKHAGDKEYDEYIRWKKIDEANKSSKQKALEKAAEEYEEWRASCLDWYCQMYAIGAQRGDDGVDEKISKLITNDDFKKMVGKEPIDGGSDFLAALSKKMSEKGYTDYKENWMKVLQDNGAVDVSGGKDLFVKVDKDGKKRFIFFEATKTNIALILEDKRNMSGINWKGFDEEEQRLAKSECLKKWKKVSFNGKEDILSQSMPKGGPIPGSWAKWVENIVRNDPPSGYLFWKNEHPLLQQFVRDVIGDDKAILKEFLLDVARNAPDKMELVNQQLSDEQKKLRDEIQKENFEKLKANAEKLEADEAELSKLQSVKEESVAEITEEQLELAQGQLKSAQEELFSLTDNLVATTTTTLDTTKGPDAYAPLTRQYADKQKEINDKIVELRKAEDELNKINEEIKAETDKLQGLMSNKPPVNKKDVQAQYERIQQLAANRVNIEKPIARTKKDISNLEKEANTLAARVQSSTDPKEKKPDVKGIQEAQAKFLNEKSSYDQVQAGVLGAAKVLKREMAVLRSLASEYTPNSLLGRYVALQDRIDKGKEDKKKLFEDLKKIDTELATAEKQLRDISGVKVEVVQPPSTSSVEVKVAKSSNAAKVKSKDAEELEQTIAKLKADQQKIKEKIRERDNDIFGDEQVALELAEQIKSLKGEPNDEPIKQAISLVVDARKELNEIEKRGEIAQKVDIAALEEDIKQARKELQEILGKDSKDDVEFRPRGKEFLTKQEELHKIEEGLEKKKKELNELKGKLSKAKDTTTGKDDEVAKLQQAIKDKKVEIRKDEATIDGLKNEIDTLSKDIHNSEPKSEEIVTQLNAARKKLDEQIGILKKAKQELADRQKLEVENHNLLLDTTQTVTDSSLKQMYEVLAKKRDKYEDACSDYQQAAELEQETASKPEKYKRLLASLSQGIAKFNPEEWQAKKENRENVLKELENIYKGLSKKEQEELEEFKKDRENKLKALDAKVADFLADQQLYQNSLQAQRDDKKVHGMFSKLCKATQDSIFIGAAEKMVQEFLGGLSVDQKAQLEAYYEKEKAKIFDELEKLFKNVKDSPVEEMEEAIQKKLKELAAWRNEINKLNPAKRQELLQYNYVSALVALSKFQGDHEHGEAVNELKESLLKDMNKAIDKNECSLAGLYSQVVELTEKDEETKGIVLGMIASSQQIEELENLEKDFDKGYDEKLNTATKLSKTKLKEKDIRKEFTKLQDDIKKFILSPAEKAKKLQQVEEAQQKAISESKQRVGEEEEKQKAALDLQKKEKKNVLRFVPHTGPGPT